MIRNRGLIALGQILLFFALVGCSGAWHVRQAVKKGVIIKSDTVYQEKTVIVPGDSTTVFVPVKQLRDTIFYKDRIKVKYSVRHDTIRFNVECPPDTVKIEVPIAVNTEINCPPRSPFWRNLALALLVVTALVIYFKR